MPPQRPLRVVSGKPHASVGISKIQDLKFKMANGKWQMANGRWQSEIGNRNAVGKSKQQSAICNN
jgi:hypothetical protein